MRKFVKGVLNECGMHEPIKSYCQGHKPKISDMDAVYGTRPVDETFAQQLRYLPNGPIGVFRTVESRDDRIPPELAALYKRFMAGEIDRLEFADVLLRLKLGPLVRANS